MFRGLQGIKYPSIFIYILTCNIAVAPANPIASSGGFLNSSPQSQNWWRNGASLDLDFAQDRYYLNGTAYLGIANFITASGASFTRSSTATYYNNSGVITSAANDVPRIDYDPVTHAPKGILIEESSTNYANQSANISSWTKTAAITFTANATTAPDGSATATLVSADGTGLSYIGQGGLPSVANTVVTKSVYAKAGTTSRLFFEFYDGSYKNAAFDLSAKTATFAAGTASLIDVGNGWYRAVATYSYGASGLASQTIYVGTYGNGVGNLYLWGAQFEKKDFVTSYIPTTTSSVTRSADNFSIPSASWFSGSIGTFVSQGFAQKNSNQPFYGRLIGGDSSRCYGGYNGSFSNAGVWNTSTSNYLTGTVTASYSSNIKMALAWDDSAMTLSLAVSKNTINSNIAYTGTWATTTIYPAGSAYNPLNAPLTRITYFPARMPDGYLKDMTR